MPIDIRTPRPLIAYVTTFLALGIFAPAAGLAGQENPLLQRWVGRHPPNRPLFLDFYSDSMLVVNDRHVTDFWYTGDSLVVFGDTTFTVRYEFRYDKMLIHTADGTTVTMSHQPISARPIHGGQLGTWGSWVASTADGASLLLEMTRSGGRARWRHIPGGSWTVGEWEKDARTIRFEWEPDSTTWVAQYDAVGHQLIFEQTEPGTSVTIFRRYYRGRD